MIVSHKKPFFLAAVASLAALLLLTSCTPTEEQIRKKAARIHAKAVTVDSHTDTPMWFMQEGFSFGDRHESEGRRYKLDIPRMKEGGLDGVFFAAFLGQKSRDPEGNAEALAEANKIIDSIYAVVNRYPEDLEIARNPADLKRIVNQDKHAIFLGLENGYPVGNNLALVDSFHHAGIRYITLCHSFNNDICDSSTDTTEHNGLSEFGKQVVQRMNELGMMIDVSHASDRTFYDVVALSSAPVIASHSCARALCDHPRNLDDAMLRKLRENGGVIQMCILSAYVKTPEPFPARDSARMAVREKHGDYYELGDDGRQAFLSDWYQVDSDFPPQLATVADVVDHIDHIVEVAGIDHVGIGTDFDGGGGVEDCFDVSELGNITLELVRRGYSARDIKKIWSGNLMRVMQEAAPGA